MLTRSWVSSGLWLLLTVTYHVHGAAVNTNHTRAPADSNPPPPQNILDALAVVRQAQVDAALRSQQRFANPAKNIYKLRPASKQQSFNNSTNLKAVDDHVAKAAALVAEYEAKTNPTPPLNLTDDGIFGLNKRDGGSFWMEGVERNGAVAIGGKPGYKVFRNVRDFGAIGNGVADDTAAINAAISSGGRCGENCGSSTTSPALVYFPPGVYLVSSPIISYYNTQLIGNAIQRPIIRAAKSFVGLGIISSDVYIPNGNSAEWYLNQNNFLRQIRNFNIDVRAVPNVMPGLEDVTPAGIHWQVAQATSIQNVRIIMSTDPNTNQAGIWMENGSGGFMSDVSFLGGKVGAFLGNQQFTIRGFTFQGCQTAVHMLWDWAFTMKSFKIDGCQVAFNVTENAGGRDGKRGQGIGSMTILDSTISNTPVGIQTFGQIDGATTAIFVENLKLNSVETAIRADGRTIVALPGGTGTIASWASGSMYSDTDLKNFGDGVRNQAGGPITPLLKAPLDLIGDDGWFERSKPQYEDVPASQFWNVKTKYGALGNGRSDDTAAINKALSEAAAAKAIAYFPYGIYVITDTIFIPPGSRVVGEVWPQIMAVGQKFEDVNNARVAVRVGNEGDKGSVELQDLLFTVRGATAGAIVVQWNIHEDKQGSAAMWDCHVRVGGAAGSSLQAEHCPKLTGQVNPKCMAASLLMHQTSQSSGYFENVWVWTADHDMDKVSQDQIDIYSARGWLIESEGPSWLYGTAAEHNVLYQYQIYNATNIFLGMIQTESPYFQSTPGAPAPFQPSIVSKRDTTTYYPNDPAFDDCDGSDRMCAVSWALRIHESLNIHLYGAGLYSWFNNYDQDGCLYTDTCQAKLVDMDDSTSTMTRVHNLVTIGAQNMMDATYAGSIPATNYKNGFASSLMGWVAGTPSNLLAKKSNKKNARVEDIPVDAYTQRLAGFIKCTDKDKAILKQALQDALKVAFNVVNLGKPHELDPRLDPNHKYPFDAWETYFGEHDGTSVQNWAQAFKNYFRMLGADAQQQDDFVKKKKPFPWGVGGTEAGGNSYPITFECIKPGDQIGHKCLRPGSKVGAAAHPNYDNPTGGDKAPWIAIMDICPRFLDTRTDPLHRLIGRYEDLENSAAYLVSRPGIIIHEMMHFFYTKEDSPIMDQCEEFEAGIWPRHNKDEHKTCKDLGGTAKYGPFFASELALNSDPFKRHLAEQNADNYQYHAMSIYMNLYNSKWKPDALSKRGEVEDVMTDEDDELTKVDPHDRVTCHGDNKGIDYARDCYKAATYSDAEYDARDTISTNQIQGSYEVGKYGSCTATFTPNSGVRCYWYKTDLKDHAISLATECGAPSTLQVDFDQGLGRKCSGVLELKQGDTPKEKTTVYIVGDSVFSYDSSNGVWTGKHKWLSFKEDKDPRKDDNVLLNWCAASGNMAAQGETLPDTYKSGQWPTGAVGTVTPFGNIGCEYVNNPAISYNNAGPGDVVGELKCLIGLMRGKCVKYNGKDIWPGYLPCASDKGQHMHFIFAVCEFQAP
ncbi:hypothetical protein TWF694_005357 [Orbilia ellipsospora]|uniref:Rhamnogalacturonase A/B/Epimerase-like pectate lyase domain-containing protein n=1 Tax=Orbilia ellipsospora TaxID=2528407 RepID=A0AAV9WU27_9PEZI